MKIDNACFKNNYNKIKKKVDRFQAPFSFVTVSLVCRVSTWCLLMVLICYTTCLLGLTCTFRLRMGSLLEFQHLILLDVRTL
jgi:hypothetical protein